MKPRHASVLVAVLVAAAATAACKRAPDAPSAAPGVAPVTQSGDSGSASAAADPWAAPKQVKDPLPHPLLWAAEKDGHTTYFLGTMHMGVDPETRLPAVVWTKLDHARAFAMETNLSDPSLGDMKRHDGGSLHRELGDAYWHKLQTALPGIADRVDLMKPMVAATMLSLRGLPQTAPMDGVLLAHAQREHKQIVYLEPASKEEALLEKWMDTRALKDMLDDLDWSEQHSKAMLAAYIAGDEKKILALADEERAEWLREGHPAAQYDQQMQELLYNRNASWVPELEKMHAEGGGFVAVGAMHLIGQRSVLDLLAHDGYKITRVGQ